jgi:serine/threonine protein kinase
MDFYKGSVLSDASVLALEGVDFGRISDKISTVFCRMIFEHGFVHCDPHPGNILVTASGDIVLLDHGLYRTLGEHVRIGYARMWLAMIEGDESALESAFNSIACAAGRRPAEEGPQEAATAAGESLAGAGYVSYRGDFSDHRLEDGSIGEGREGRETEKVDGGVPVMHHRLIGCILSQRAWQTVQQGGITARTSKEESQMISRRAPEYLGQAAKLLANLPPEIVMLLKTNDLLRHLERKLMSAGLSHGSFTPAVSRSLIITAHECVHTICRYDLLHGDNPLSPLLRAFWLHLCIDAYRVYCDICYRLQYL